MKYANSKLKTLTTLLLTLFALAVVGCQSDKVSNLAGPDEGANYQDTPLSSLEKKGGPGGNQGNMHFPYSVKTKLSYINHNKGYEAGILQLPDGSKFKIRRGSLTPPPGVTIGDHVTITMEVDLGLTNNERIYTFGPSGCQFDRPAEIEFYWTDLGSSHASLYYIESNGNRILQTPDYVDISNRKMTLYVDHFSRYALAAD